MRIFIIVTLIILAGCGTRNYKEFDFSNVRESQGVIIGKVDVEYNSKPFEITWCQFCAGTGAGTVCHHLLEDGYVFMPVGKGPLTEGRLSCAYPDVCCEDILFTVDAFEVTPGITYFGNLFFTVDIESSRPNLPAQVTRELPDDYSQPPEYDYSSWRNFTESLVEDVVGDVMEGAVEGVVTEVFSSDKTSRQRVQYMISFGLSVQDGMNEVMEVFRRQAKKKDVEVEKNLLNIKLDNKEKSFQRDL